MTEQKDEMQELSLEIRKCIENNKKFLDHMFDDDFESEDEELQTDEVFEEL